MLSPDDSQPLLMLLDCVSATDALAGRLARLAEVGDIIGLAGDLGAGKTTFARALIRARIGPVEVPSPTFTLVETYELAQMRVAHFDLFRVESIEELETLGVRDYFADGNLCVFEWPDRGQGLLPTPRVLIEFDYHGEGRLLTITRNSMAV